MNAHTRIRTHAHTHTHTHNTHTHTHGTTKAISRIRSYLLADAPVAVLKLQLFTVTRKYEIFTPTIQPHICMYLYISESKHQLEMKSIFLCI